MPTRAISWAVLLVLVVSGILYASQLVVTAVTACCAFVGAFEFCILVRRIGWKARIWVLAPYSFITVLVAGSQFWDVEAALFVPLFGLISMLSAFPYLLWTNIRGVFKMVFSEVIGLTYLGFTLSYLPVIAAGENGRVLLLYGLIIISATDTGAYVFGRLFGKRQLAPTISPAKTIEGALGGLFSGVFSSVVIGKALSLGIGGMALILVGFVLSIIGQAGDLAESKLKRLAKVKDSGRIIPGQGGILDRIDSVVLALPVLYHILSMDLA